MAFIPVLIIQTSDSGFDACKKDLTKAGFEEFKDFEVFGSCHRVAEHFEPTADQLLVTGSFHGDESAAVQFVKSCKEKHPKLKTAFFSIYSGDTSYDLQLEKGRGKDFCNTLILAMKEFLQR